MSKKGKILIGVLVTAIVVTLLVFSNVYEQHVECKSVIFDIQTVGDTLLSVEELTQALPFPIDSMKTKLIADINFVEIENELAIIPYVKKVKVYSSFFGGLHIDIEEREPKSRFQFQNGPICFADEDGFLMPIQKGKISRTILVSGFIPGNYNALKEGGLLNNEEEFKGLDSLFFLTSNIINDPFLSLTFSQIWMSKVGEIFISPMFGRHLVEFGELKDISNKLFRLKVFYLKGISDNGWRDYKSVSVKYDNQIICSKK